MKKNKSLRTCLFTNKQHNKDELVRLVKINKTIVIDYEKNMLGRGYWIKLIPEVLDNPKCISILSKRCKCSITNELVCELKGLIENEKKQETK